MTLCRWCSREIHGKPVAGHYCSLGCHKAQYSVAYWPTLAGWLLDTRESELRAS
jgi:hypothetical protein